MKTGKTGGFTLIEIMLVVTIIGILAAVVLPRLAGRGEEARISAARLQLENFSMALDAFDLDTGHFPASEEGLQALLTKPGNATNWKGPYLKKSIPKDPWGNLYIYKYPGAHNSDYDLESYGVDGVDGGDNDIENWETK